MMKSERRRLPLEDRRMVDLLLDPGEATQSTVMKVIAPVNPHRLAATQQMLKLLEEFPVPEPPADLIDRTMELVDSNPIPPPAPLNNSQTMDRKSASNPPTSS